MEAANKFAKSKSLPLPNRPRTLRGSIVLITLELVCLLWDIHLLGTELEKFYPPPTNIILSDSIPPLRPIPPFGEDAFGPPFPDLIPTHHLADLQLNHTDHLR